MIATLALILAQQTQTPAETAADYVFLTAGVNRYYTSKLEKDVTETVDVIGTPQLVGTAELIPVTTRVGRAEAEKYYYQIKDGDVYIVANWDKKPIDPPVPMLRLGPTEMKWSWNAGGVSFDYTSRRGKNRNVFGKDLPTVELIAKGNDGDDVLARKVEQTAIFAKGLGMVEMVEVTSTKKTKTTRTVKLTKITGGGW